MPSRRFGAVGVAAILIAASIAGALAVTALDIDLLPSDPDADELVADVLERNGDIESLQATRIYEYEIHDGHADEPRTGRTTAEVWMRPPDRSRTEIVSTTEPGRNAGDVSLISGSTFKRYNADRGTMLVDDDWRGDAVYHWPELYDADLDAEYVGTDTVDGREAYVVEVEPAENESATAISLLVGDTEYELAVGDGASDGRNVTTTTTLWIDAETRFPIKERLETEHENPDEHVLRRERAVWTVAYEDVRFDAEIPDERFSFEPPAGTDVYEPAEPYDVDTVAEADEAAPFDVREPVVPDRFDLVHVSGREFRGNASVELLYRDGDILEGDTVRVRISEAPFDPAIRDAVEENVGEHEGTLISAPSGTGYAWECDGAYYEVVVDDSSDEEALAIELGDSVDCP